MTDASILPGVLDAVGFEAGGRRLIEDISLRLEPGPLTVILGHNGAGKSLLLRLCHGLLSPSHGRIDWNGRSAQAATRRQAMVFQRPVLLRRSAAANIAYALKVRGVPAGRRRGLVREALDRAGLSAIGDRPARVLSGGEQQRLALARAWSLRPEVLFLDEPTANLDPAAIKVVEAMIRAIAGTGAKVVMTTHDLAQSRRLAEEVVFIAQGRIVEHAAADRFFAGPRSAEAAAYLEGRLP